MHPESSRHSPYLLALLLVFTISVGAIGAQITSGSNQRQKFGDLDGAGVLPFVGPSAPNHPLQMTPGLVVDAQRNAIVGTLVVVTHPVLGVVAVTHTDSSGVFAVELPQVANLELALPQEALAGIEVTPGVPLVIVVP